jgi:hypothetical protein
MTVRIVALIMISCAAVWVGLEIVSLALGTTEFGWSAAVRARVRVGAELLMWLGVAISVARTAIDLFLGLMDRLGMLDDEEEEARR